MTKEEVLARLAESRRALHQAIEDLSEEEMTQIQVEGVWTIPSTLLRTGKDVLGHIASWEETYLEPLRHYADGGSFEVEVIEGLPGLERGTVAPQDEQAARKRDVPLDVILDELAAVRQELVEAASRLSAEQWKQWVPFAWGSEGTIADTLRGLHVHEMEHVRHIQQWRGG